MAEHITSEFTNSCNNLIEAAYGHVSQAYGPASATHLAYHDLSHTQGTVQAVELLAGEALKSGKIQPRIFQLLRVAGAYHDYVYGKGSVISEQESADAAMQAMESDKHFHISDFTIVRNAIMATVMREDAPGRLVQSAGLDDYPSQLLADADLASLGKPRREFWQRARLLYAEYYPVEQRNPQTYGEFNTMQVAFLSGHEYYTAEARQFFPNQPANLESIREAIAAAYDPKTHRP